MDKKIMVWSPISFTEKWLQVNTSKFDDIVPSWYEKRKEIKDDNKDFEDFLNRLKRHHAIETGIVEKLYDLSDGITQTFIKEGFIESFIGHEDTNIPAKQLMSYLKDHFDAMDFVFDLVKKNRPLSKSFILELHQLITMHQDYTFGFDSLGKYVKIPLLKGKFKEFENNPKRDDGTIYEYCPPIQTEIEVENLLRIYTELDSKKTHPLIISSWFHHAFTQIHPFQDGNGRIARLLASLILIKNNLFPFTVKRDEKAEYIRALENADNNEPQQLVAYFSLIQRQNIETILNLQTTEVKSSSLQEIASIFNEKISIVQTKKKKQRQDILNENLDGLFKLTYEIIRAVQKELFKIIPKEKALINAIGINPKEDNYYWYTKQIVDYANQHNYYFNKYLPRGWFKVSFTIPKGIKYDLVITLHHFGYHDSVIAIGSFLQFTDENSDEQTIPIDIKPYTLSLENEITKETKFNVEEYIKDITKIGMTIIVNEII